MITMFSIEKSFLELFMKIAFSNLDCYLLTLLQKVEGNSTDFFYLNHFYLMNQSPLYYKMKNAIGLRNHFLEQHYLSL